MYDHNNPNYKDLKPPSNFMENDDPNLFLRLGKIFSVINSWMALFLAFFFFAFGTYVLFNTRFPASNGKTFVTVYMYSAVLMSFWSFYVSRKPKKPNPASGNIFPVPDSPINIFIYPYVLSNYGSEFSYVTELEKNIYIMMQLLCPWGSLMIMFLMETFAYRNINTALGILAIGGLLVASFFCLKRSGERIRRLSDPR